jgi:hypothetical protein
MKDFHSGPIELDTRTRGLIRAILYPVIFRISPDERDVARVINLVVNRRALDASPTDYQNAILKALESGLPLADLSDNDRSDAATREFLRAVLGQIEPATEA